MNAQAKVADRVEMLRTDSDIFVAGTMHAPAVDRVVKEILNEHPHSNIDPGEDVAMDAVTQNIKRWCGGF